ncbi:SET and MYND domain containing, class 5 isoform X2 [Tachypleus tridentatus]|uniref:SET and MYND domain containing, class 5 isoform X2 n=1 Tax=Tachypleus tridentatus TaxID=6853 RepID=UPI003FD4FA01
MEASCGDTHGVEVREIGGSKGKGLFALCKFSAGETIFEERPLVCSQFLWNQAYGYLACDYCMRPLETAEENARRLSSNHQLVLPYPQCCNTKKENHVDCSQCEVSYCSVACRSLAWEQYHQFLCLGSSTGDSSHPLEQLQVAWRNVHYPPETASIMLIARMIATVKQAKDKEGAVHLFSQFCHNTVNEEEQIAHKLLGERFQVQLEQLRELLSKALFEECIYHWFTPEGFRSLIALVGTNGQGVGTSPLSVWTKNCDALDLPTEEKQHLNEFIDHLYEEVDKGNHSCVPNAEATFPYSNFVLVMEAVKDIEPGEEIVVCYLDDCNRHRSRHSRIKLLRENYLFTCTCPKCESEVNDPDMTSEEEMSEDNEETSNDTV